MIICLSANITMRLPDTYQYSLSSSQILTVAPVVVDETSLVNTFGDYMQHKTNDFSLKEAVDYKPQDVFNKKDKAAMFNLRKALDIMLIVGIAMLLISAVCYFFLIRWRKKQIHMSGYKWAVLCTIILLGVNSLLKVVPILRTWTWGRLFGAGFPDGDLLILVLENNFAIQVSIFDVVISLIILGILGYATWEFSGRKKMFKQF